MQEDSGRNSIWDRWFRRNNNRRAENKGRLTGSSGELDTLSTNSFAFVRSSDRQLDPVTLRRKYGLLGSDSGDEIKGDAIRAMRTQWESQIRQMDDTFNSTGQKSSRKKRPAPQPPVQQTISRPSSHVPGKRKAPSPPIKKLNIPPPDKPVRRLSSEVVANKWTNDLNSNLDDRAVKAVRYQQSKIDCPQNDILKLEGGLLRPLTDRSVSTKSVVETTPASTMESQRMQMMTLPLKPWYKRHHSHHHHPTTSRWKDAVLLHPPEDPIRPPVSPEPPLTSPAGSTRSGGSSSSDGSKKRKSLLVNISQLDREAAEIIQRERARESQKKKLEDEKFYSAVAELEEEEPASTSNTRELIQMFNSMSDAENRPAAGPATTADANNKTSADVVTDSTITRLRVNQETVCPSAVCPSPSSSVFSPKLEAPASRTEYAGARPKKTGPATEPVVGWACHVCTLVNCDARLWCEACTALKPRRPLPVSPVTIQVPVERIQKTEEDKSNKTDVPSSPEALRQARLAFFLQTDKPEENNNKRNSIKVSSGCQTQPMQRPLSGINQQPGEAVLISFSNRSESSSVRVKSVNPTQFPSILSPSRTQLSQYLRDQQASKNRTADPSPPVENGKISLFPMNFVN